MKTLFGKIFVVLVLFGSLSFLGFALASYFGGPNWQSEMLVLEGPGDDRSYQFTRSESPPHKWTVNRANVANPVANTDLAPQALIAAYKDLTNRQQQELSDLQKAESDLTQRLEAWKKNQADDEKALEARRAELLELYKASRDRASQLATQVAQQTEEAQKIEQRIAERREDVIRLLGQLSEIKTDAFRLEELKQELTDQLQQANATLDRAKERNERLRAEVSGG